MNREDVIILAAANIFAASTKNMSRVEAVQHALEIEKEVIKQRKAQDKERITSMEEFAKQIPPRLCPGTLGRYCATHNSSIPHYIPEDLPKKDVDFTSAF